MQAITLERSHLYRALHMRHINWACTLSSIKSTPQLQLHSINHRIINWWNARCMCRYIAPLSDTATFRASSSTVRLLTLGGIDKDRWLLLALRQRCQPLYTYTLCIYCAITAARVKTLKTLWQLVRRTCTGCGASVTRSNQCMQFHLQLLYLDDHKDTNTHACVCRLNYSSIFI